MATHRIPVIGWQVLPDSSGNCFFEPYPIKATNDRWDHGVFVFNDDAADCSFHNVFQVPSNYVGTGSFIVIWTSTATTGNIVWGINYRGVGGNDAESLDQTGQQESLSVTDAAPSAAHERLEASMAITSSNLAADDTVQMTLFRDNDNASDTMAAAGLVFELIFQYSDA